MKDKRIVLDCSVAMAWCFRDEATAYTNGVLAALETHSAIVPAIWPLEVANVLIIAERRGRLSETDVHRSLGIFQLLPISVEGNSPQKVFGDVITIARKFQLTCYDAAYLELAIRERLPLATTDKALRTAARKSKVVLLPI